MVSGVVSAHHIFDPLRKKWAKIDQNFCFPPSSPFHRKRRLVQATTPFRWLRPFAVSVAFRWRSLGLGLCTLCAERQFRRKFFYFIGNFFIWLKILILESKKFQPYQNRWSQKTCPSVTLFSLRGLGGRMGTKMHRYVPLELNRGPFFAFALKGS